MDVMAGQDNSAYDSPEVVARYADPSAGLMPSEATLFAKHLRPGMDILDVGVGAGRTTPALSALGGRYVGVDYSASMVSACRERFPELEFVEADAADLSAFADASFDAVVFSFNGIDCLPSDESRLRFLDEAHRVLRPDGRLILSRHNARALFLVPLARDHSLRGRLGLIKYALLENAWRLRAVPTQRPFWSGEGLFRDHADEGIDLQVATRERAVQEITGHGFELLDVVGSNHPRNLPSALTPWWYFAFRHRG